MDFQLNEVEVRVLGCLIEKAITTPEYYPLTLNALTNACNQKSNRDPVVEFDGKAVVRAVDGLRDKKLAWLITTTGGRAPKYEHSFAKALNLTPEQVAVLCELMLRGPQTVGELRGHCERLCKLETIAAVEAVIEKLMTGEQGVLVTKLPRQTGRKEHRYAHLLAGEPKIENEPVTPPPAEPARVAVQAENERIGKLEGEVALLRQELAVIREEFAKFRKQFE